MDSVFETVCSVWNIMGWAKSRNTIIMRVIITLTEIHWYMSQGDKSEAAFPLQWVPHFTCKPCHKSDNVFLKTSCHNWYLHFWPQERNLLFRKRQDVRSSIKVNRIQCPGTCLNHLVITQWIVNMKCTPPPVSTSTRVCTPLHTWTSFPLCVHTTKVWM